MENSEGKKKKDIPIIDASSLINLKAELLKKQESVKQAKLYTSNETTSYRPFRVKGEVRVEREKSTKPEVTEDAKEEEDLALRKSRAALEAKSKLYDKIASNPSNLTETEDEMYLVNFHRKAARNRNLRAYSDSPNIRPTDNANSSTYSGSSYTDQQSSPPTSESSKETHYQNIHFNEKRDFGVGYFSFSTMEEERKQQLEELDTLHEKTKKRRRQHEEAMEKKKLSLESRLAKICRRRNIDTSLISEFTSKLAKSDSHPVDNTNAAVDLDSIPLPESEDVEKRPAKVRPWDVGKQFINFQKENDTLPQ